MPVPHPPSDGMHVVLSRRPCCQPPTPTPFPQAPTTAPCLACSPPWTWRRPSSWCTCCSRQSELGFGGGMWVNGKATHAWGLTAGAPAVHDRVSWSVGGGGVVAQQVEPHTHVVFPLPHLLFTVIKSVQGCPRCELT